jgi:anti-sigma-K factor RskA
MSDRGPDHERWADAVGSYVLEALPEDERRGFELHLDDCPACRRDVEELQVAADALPMSVEPLAPSPALKARIMDVVHSEAELLAAAADRPEAAGPAPRTRRRPWSGFLLRPGLALACAAVLLVLGGVGGALLAGGDGVATSDAVVDQAQAPGGRVQLETGDGGSRLVAENFPPPSRGRVYQVWLKRPGADPEPTSVLWSVRRDGTAEVAVPGSLDDVEAVLVTSEPDGGSARPSRRPVIAAEPA